MGGYTIGFLVVLLSAMGFMLINSREQGNHVVISSKAANDEFKRSAPGEKFEWMYEEKFFGDKALDTLQTMIRSNKIAVILEDEGVESGGEQVPAGHADCDRPYMALGKNGSFCAFPHRIDVAMNYFKIGGFSGIMESLDNMAARLFSFRHKLLHLYEPEQLKSIYGDKFLQRAHELCLKNGLVEFDSNQLVTDLFQFDVIIVLPGQELPMHLDIPYFWGADRKSLPHWLLVIMKRSGLFDHMFIPQVQGVSWLSRHQLNKNEEESRYNGGNFYFYPFKSDAELNTYLMAQSTYNSAILVDGTQVVHGVERYKPTEEPPFLEKGQSYHLLFDESKNKWNLLDSTNRVMRTYPHEDIRISLVWRTHCFKNEQEKRKYKAQPAADRIPIDKVLDVFKKNMVEKRGFNAGSLEQMRKIDFLKLLVDEYSKYPNNKYNSWYSNYCLVTTLTPDWLNQYLLNPLLKFVC